LIELTPPNKQHMNITTVCTAHQATMCIVHNIANTGYGEWWLWSRNDYIIKTLCSTKYCGTHSSKYSRWL